ncbi:MerC domain-containing protein [Tunicatimonas pelagia]|uniref:MerC domain-containing protein n=1 Tax=Tunicatimonas pelagia TaxID=931531 RepID=UPI0026665F7A|nr:MerC domain-containing protein [Tunicatimonas pelagia]WKN44169.1 MerC domain-containing protein [Tunicatimonas pelagia]
MKNKFVGLHSDFVGFSASLLCALHCAALPFLLTLAPLAGLQFLRNPWIEYTLILISFCIACYALIPGYRRYHRKPLALILVLLGFLLIGSGRFLEPESVLTSSGAVLVAIAHLVNWKQVQQARAALSNYIHSLKNTKQNA